MTHLLLLWLALGCTGTPPEPDTGEGTLLGDQDLAEVMSAAGGELVTSEADHATYRLVEVDRRIRGDDYELLAKTVQRYREAFREAGWEERAFRAQSERTRDHRTRFQRPGTDTVVLLRVSPGVDDPEVHHEAFSRVSLAESAAAQPLPDDPWTELTKLSWSDFPGESLHCFFADDELGKFQVRLLPDGVAGWSPPVTPEWDSLLDDGRWFLDGDGLRVSGFLAASRYDAVLTQTVWQLGQPLRAWTMQDYVFVANDQTRAVCHQGEETGPAVELQPWVSVRDAGGGEARVDKARRAVAAAQDQAPYLLTANEPAGDHAEPGVLVSVRPEHRDFGRWLQSVLARDGGFESVRYGVDATQDAPIIVWTGPPRTSPAP